MNLFHDYLLYIYIVESLFEFDPRRFNNFERIFHVQFSLRKIGIRVLSLAKDVKKTFAWSMSFVFVITSVVYSRGKRYGIPTIKCVCVCVSVCHYQIFIFTVVYCCHLQWYVTSAQPDYMPPSI